MYIEALPNRIQRARRLSLQPRALAFAALAALAIALPATAVTYKWTDANGRVVYSDQPPPSGVKAEQIGTAAPPSNPNAVKEMASKDAELKKRQLDRNDADAKAAKDQATNTQRRDLCLVVRGKIKEIEGGAAVYKYNEKGERVNADEAGRQAELAKQRDYETKFCGAST